MSKPKEGQGICDALNALQLAEEKLRAANLDLIADLIIPIHAITAQTYKSFGIHYDSRTMDKCSPRAAALRGEQ